VLLFFAGHETTVNLLGNGLAAMLQSRDQWAALCAEPDLAHSAVEEMLRFDTPVQRANRVALTDVVLDGEAISAGEMVMILIAGANRDPLRFSDPETFDLRRADGPHLSFSSGPHYCSGATLARVEAEIAMSSLARRFPNLELSNEPLRSRPNVVLRGYETVPVSLRG
jgi:cytochrome P450